MLEDRATDLGPAGGVCSRRSVSACPGGPSTPSSSITPMNGAGADRGTNREDPDRRSTRRSTSATTTVADGRKSRLRNRSVSSRCWSGRLGIAHQDADGGVDIGEAGAADVKLHGGLSGAKRSAMAADVPVQASTTLEGEPSPDDRPTTAGDLPGPTRNEPTGPDRTRRNAGAKTLHPVRGAAYDAPHLSRAACSRAPEHLEEYRMQNHLRWIAVLAVMLLALSACTNGGRASVTRQRRWQHGRRPGRSLRCR